MYGFCFTKLYTELTVKDLVNFVLPLICYPISSLSYSSIVSNCYIYSSDYIIVSQRRMFVDILYSINKKGLSKSLIYSFNI